MPPVLSDTQKPAKALPALVLACLVLASCGGSAGSTTASAAHGTSTAGAKSASRSTGSTTSSTAGAPASNATKGGAPAAPAVPAIPVSIVGHCLVTQGVRTCGLPGKPSSLRLGNPVIKEAVTRFATCVHASAGSKAADAKCRSDLVASVFLGVGSLGPTR